MNAKKLLYKLQVLHSAANKSFIQKRHEFVEYETEIMQRIYDKLETYFPAEIRRNVWQMTIKNHRGISYNDIRVSSGNPQNCEEICLSFLGGDAMIFTLTYRGTPNCVKIPYKENSIKTVKELKEKIEMFRDVVRFEKQLDWGIDVFYTKLKNLDETK